MGALIGAAVALAVPLWLVVEELMHRQKLMGRAGRKSERPAPAAAPGAGASAALRHTAA